MGARLLRGTRTCDPCRSQSGIRRSSNRRTGAGVAVAYSCIRAIASRGVAERIRAAAARSSDQDSGNGAAASRWSTRSSPYRAKPACMNSSTLPPSSVHATWKRAAPRFWPSRRACWTSRNRMSPPPAPARPVNPSSSTIVQSSRWLSRSTRTRPATRRSSSYTNRRSFGRKAPSGSRNRLNTPIRGPLTGRPSDLPPAASSSHSRDSSPSAARSVRRAARTFPVERPARGGVIGPTRPGASGGDGGPAPPAAGGGGAAHAGSDSLDDRRANKHRVNGLIPQDRHLQVRLEGVELAPEGVPPDIDIEQGEDGFVAIGDVARQQDHPGAGPEDRRAGTSEFQDRLTQAPPVDEAALGGGFPAGQDQPAEILELGRQAHLDALDADGLEDRHVLGERPLDGEDPDLHRSHPAVAGAAAYQPREASRSDSASCSIAMPRIGAPRPLLTSARIFGSSKCVVAWTMAFAMRAGSSLLKTPDPTNTPSAPSCMTRAASAGVEMPPATKFTTGSLPSCATFLTSS